MMISNIPNLISIYRLLTIPFVAWLMLVDLLFYAAFFTLLIAISDFLDGFLARKLNVKSELGAYLDAIADKAFVISIFILIGNLNLLPLSVIILVVSRDIIILGAFIISFFAGIKTKFNPLKISKANTFFQFFLVIVTLLGNTNMLEIYVKNYLIIEILIFIVVLTTSISLIIYIMHWMKNT